MLELNPYHIITTNYDGLIEQQANQKGMFYDVVSKDSDLPYTPNNKMIIKMHGDFKNRNIVFKEDDYLSYSQNFKLIETYIKSLLSTHTILFVGYSLSDPDIQYIFQWVKDILGSDLPRPYFLKIDKDNEFDINEYQYYKNKGIKFVKKQNRDDIKYRRKIIYKNRKKYRFLEMEESLRMLDYSKLKDFISNIDDSEMRNNYKLSMERAYAMYYIGEYYDSYKEYKKISENA